MNKTINNDYYDFLYNKKVCVVGGGPNVSEALIKTADLVVRVNNHWLRTGGRCDILYITGAALFPKLLTPLLRPNYIWYSFNMVWKDPHPIEFELQAFCRKHSIPFDKFLQTQFQDVNPVGPEYEWANVLHKRIRTMPFTGTVAVYHLLRFPVKQLALTGFDFYLESCVDGEIPYARGPHNMPRQIALFDELKETDARMVVDQTLRDILGGKYPVEEPIEWMVGDQKFLRLKKKREKRTGVGHGR